MRISTLVVMLLAVSVVVFLFVQMTNEAETIYGIDINQSDFEDNYDFASDVNESISPVIDSVNTIRDGESGFFSIVSAAFTGIIAAVKFLPDLFLSMISSTAGLVMNIGGILGIPGYILLVVILLLSAWGLFELIAFLQRWNL